MALAKGVVNGLGHGGSRWLTSDQPSDRAVNGVHTDPEVRTSSRSTGSPARCRRRSGPFACWPPTWPGSAVRAAVSSEGAHLLLAPPLPRLGGADEALAVGRLHDARILADAGGLADGTGTLV